MFRPLTRSHRRAPRRGTVVVITIFALITILMVLGLAFMMYAVKEKAVAQAHKEAASSPGTAAPDPTSTINKFLGTLLYDDYDDADALHNALRGHSIARAMYGSRSDYSNTNPWVGSTVPWAGVGTFHEDPAGYLSGPATTYPSLAGLLPATRRDRSRFVNHTVMTLDSKALVIDPEWTGNRFADNTIPLQPVLTAFNQSLAGRNYVGLHAGYTYPDLKNFFLGARDPATGEVLAPSFYRDWLFRHENLTTQSALDPSNPNWGIATGVGQPEKDARLRILRPLPVDHPKFPRVPPNPDGSFTGDVQNLTGALGIQRNDSLWMHIGLKPITLADGRIVQPMVAPLILPFDGLFDQSVHGNRLGTGNAHASYGGYGPWEVNIGYGLNNYDRTSSTPAALSTALEADRQNLLINRTGVAAAFDPYTGGRQLPNYSSVSWTGAPVTFALPTAGSLRGLPSFGDPSFAPAYGGFQSTNAAVGHPAGYNPNEFVTLSDADPLKPFISPYSDIKRLSLRYAFTPDWHLQAFSAKNTSAAFRSDTGTYPYVASPGANTPSQYRLDPVHPRRNLFSPRNNSLDRPAIAPNFLNLDAAGALTFGTGPGGPTKPSALSAAAGPYPSPQGLGSISDFAAGNQWVNATAELGSVNLNRPLADYRVDTNLPLTNANTNPTVANQADQDRQALARDIFARLCVALGAAAQVRFDNTGVTIRLPDPTTFILTPVSGAPITYTAQHYWVLRYLAQLAANIVDYIDNDDVNTTFVWNPPTTGTTDFANPNDVGNRVVFGIEKPRLVLNEIYSEITNAPGDPVQDAIDPMTMMPKALAANAQAHIKFWAELLNPTSTPHTNPPALPLPPAAGPQGIFGTGAVNLSAYQIQIARQKRKTGGAPMPKDQLSAFLIPTDPEFQSNVTGRFVEAADTTFTFPAAPVNQPAKVEPNNAQYQPSDPTNLPLNGVVLVGPEVTAKTPAAAEFNPPNTGVWASTNKVTSVAPAVMGKSGVSTAMGYTLDMPPAATLSTEEFKRHTVLLRRAANPYLTPNDPLLTATYNSMLPINPYVTVDMMNEVPAFDSVHRAANGTTDRGSRPAMIPMGKNPEDYYDPVADRFSIGKVQPLAGWAAYDPTTTFTPGKYNKYDFATSMVLAQTTLATMPRPTPDPNEPKNTFGRHNGNAGQPAGSTVTAPPNAVATISDTIMTPFDWLPHMDRPLETLGDVFLARDSKPHMLTNEFVRNTPAGVVQDAGYARWRFHDNGLARALEYLTVKSPSYHVAHGGRVTGKINVNAMQDLRVAQGLWDPLTSNQLNFVNTTVWGTATNATTSWMKSRTPFQTRNNASGVATFEVPVPTSSVTDSSVVGSTASPDRPFLPFGTPAASAAGTIFAYGTGSGIDNTVLRRDLTTPVLPLLYDTTVATTYPTTHPYTQIEAFRKVHNNITTVSHSFVVYVTIGYFDVTYPATAPAGWPNNVNVPIPPQFGAEVYDKIPGDMRQKYIAFIDMANMAMKPQPVANDANPHAVYSPNSPQPFFTSLTGTVRPGAAVTTPVPISLASGTGDGTTMTILSRVPVTMQPSVVDDQRVLVSAGTQLAIGYGADIQYVTVDAVGPLGMGVNTNYPNGLGVNQLGVTGLNRPAWGGSCVSNVRPGYAGPQPLFDYRSINYKPVIPYVERLR
ncbi:hypothetical protein J8F10_24880 [Gemmata sp. G18]|uniref:Verru_Chthon cassette protein A n=1 Tax=Gemmata palustris TaxID=2822762 RepID=A0ABS5BXQ6_9BACT|nr:hypothetical protein [Gemmata palustris]MBP3958496.1 hypothetical protein [Gemmata palustris]